MRNQRNFLETPLHDDCIHEGEGLCHHATILPADAFEAPIRFVNYTILPKGASFGLHTHGDDNELYILLSGSGHYTCNGERQYSTDFPVWQDAFCRKIIDKRA